MKEYKILSNSSYLELTKMINSYAEEGWTVVGTLINYSEMRYYPESTVRNKSNYFAVLMERDKE